MVTINNEDVRETYHYLLTLNVIVEKDFQHVKGNKSHLNKLVPSQLSGLYSQKQQDALKFTDGVTRTLYDASVVALVTSFERAVFAKYRTSYGTLRGVVRDSAAPPLDFFHSRERFINDSIDKLAGILSLIDGIIDDPTMEKLKQIKDHRNYIVHGKRDSIAPAIELDIDTIAKTLDNAITSISN
ncbi:MAG: hypothetical protein JST70_01785 [Bacteroidetes bacterium]|nr:hypothetical protein [Bacteroidota bacterium]